MNRRKSWTGVSVAAIALAGAVWGARSAPAADPNVGAGAAAPFAVVLWAIRLPHGC
jgi:hypothetical protein